MSVELVSWTPVEPQNDSWVTTGTQTVSWSATTAQTSNWSENISPSQESYTTFGIGLCPPWAELRSILTEPDGGVDFRLTVSEEGYFTVCDERPIYIVEVITTP